MWIDGERTEAAAGEWREVKNPALRDTVIARVPSAGD
jgi:aldehyde dehydrogenase (NAD+)